MFETKVKSNRRQPENTETNFTLIAHADGAPFPAPSGIGHYSSICSRIITRPFPRSVLLAMWTCEPTMWVWLFFSPKEGLQVQTRRTIPQLTSAHLSSPFFACGSVL